MDQYEKGLNNVLGAIGTALEERRVVGAVVTHDAADGNRSRVEVKISVGEKSVSQHFEPEELDDCGQAIDAPAAFKVRMLVSHFVR